MAAPDLSFSNVSLLLHFDGADGSTTFTDSSPRPKTVTAIGNAKISTAQGLFGGASGYFDGSGDALSIAHAADLNLVSGDWTIEFWFYLAGNFAGAYILDKDGVENSSYPSYGITVGSDRVALHLGSGNGLSGLQSFIGTTAVSANAWHHAAFGRAGSTIYGFLDGVQQFASTQTVAMVDGGKKINIGARYDGSSFPMCGYVKDMRITKGVARYTADFTPPTEAFPTDAVEAIAYAPTPLGVGAVQADVVGGTVESWASAPSPLGNPAAYAKLSVLAQASGFAVSAFGSPTGFNVQRVSGFSSTAFGTPASPYPRTVAAEGFGTVQLGRPTAFATTEVQINRLVTATPIHSTRFGQASYSGQITAQASGHQTGAFGAPKAMQALVAQTLGAVPSFGIPALRTGLQAAGFQITDFGVPRAGRVLPAASTYRPTRWGVPSSSRSNTYLAQPAARGAKFGRPVGRSLHAYQASPVPATTAFGTALCQQRHRAASTYSGARFGKPLLLRSTAC